MVKQDSGFWSSVVVVFCPCCAISLSLLSSFSLLLSLASDPIPLPYPFFPLRALPVRPAIKPPRAVRSREVSGIGGTKVGVELPFLACLQVQETSREEQGRVVSLFHLGYLFTC